MARMRSRSRTSATNGTKSALPVVLLPDEMTPETAARTTGRIGSLYSELGILTLDLLDTYLSRPDRSLLWSRHGRNHFNESRNRLIVDEIFRYLTTTNSP